MINLFLRFAGVGAIGTAVHYATLILLVSGFHVAPSIATVIGATFGALTNYHLNRRYNFSGNGDHRHAAPRFIAMVVVGILLNGLLVQFFVLGGLHFLIAQGCATFIVLAFNFVVCKKWIFIKT